MSGPIRVDWVEPLGSVPGFRAAAERGARLGMTFTPGKHDVGSGGVHRRDLDTDVATLRDIDRVDTFVLLIEDHELELLRVPRLPAAMADAGIDLVRFPIVDAGVPPDRDAFRGLLDDLAARLGAGESVVVACRGGLGRTGTVVACLLRDGGLDADQAISATRAARRETIETDRQERFVRDWDLPGRTIAGAAGS